MSLQKETGMLDVGKHCHYCNQLDFLPFFCSYCKFNYCKTHRLSSDHNCVRNDNARKLTYSLSSNNEQYFKSLLPEKSSIRIKNDKIIIPPSNKSSLDNNTLQKLLKFFKRHKSSNKTFSSSHQILRNTAKGDDKIPIGNRIYIYVSVIDDDISTTVQDTPLYINKIWPIGRVIDYISIQYKVKNINLNHQSTRNDKLYLYKFTHDTLVSLNANDRVINNIVNNDSIYLVRGKKISTT